MTVGPGEHEVIDRLLARSEPPGTPAEAEGYSRMVEDLRTFLDRLSSARLAPAQVEELTRGLRSWSSRLAPFEVEERHRQFGRWTGSPNRAQAMVPDIHVVHETPGTLEARVRFSTFFLGVNGAAHGGAVPLMFDELVGGLALRSGGSPSRTAYLNTDFRAVAPVGPWLTARVWFDRSEGRKRFYRATVHHGEILCAETDVLLVALRPGQP